MKSKRSNKKKIPKKFYIGTHRRQELVYKSQQWWQTDHVWT